MFLSKEDSFSHHLVKAVFELPKADGDWEMPNQLQQFFAKTTKQDQQDSNLDPILSKQSGLLLQIFGQTKQDD
jgi:hypothetical protein